MESDIANFGAATIFLLIFRIFIFPIMQTYNGLPPGEVMCQMGVSHGEYAIIVIIIAVVLIWSVFHFALPIIWGFSDCISAVISNETVRNFFGALQRKANRTIGRKIRITIRDIYRDMKGHESL